MAIPDPPPDPTYFRLVLTDLEGNDTVELQQLLEDCGLRVMRAEELSWGEVERETKKLSEKAGSLRREDRKAGGEHVTDRLECSSLVIRDLSLSLDPRSQQYAMANARGPSR